MEQLLLSEQISNQLLQEMRTGLYKDASRLPPETEVAEQLGVSRTAVRDSLATLEREGFVTRKHGIGTIINRHVLAVRTRMDLEKEFLEMIADAGYTPGLCGILAETVPADETLAAQLRIEPGEEVIQVTRTVTANGIPTIHCVDSIAVSIIVDHGYDLDDLARPIFDFLQNFCNTLTYMDLTEVAAVAADESLAQALQVEIGTPVLHMNEVSYDLRGNPVLHSNEHYRSGILNHIVLRKKI